MTDNQTLSDWYLHQYVYIGNDTEQFLVKTLGLKDNKIGTGTRNTIKMGNQNKCGLEAHLSGSVAPKICSTRKLTV